MIWSRVFCCVLMLLSRIGLGNRRLFGISGEKKVSLPHAPYPCWLGGPWDFWLLGEICASVEVRTHGFYMCYVSSSIKQWFRPVVGLQCAFWTQVPIIILRFSFFLCKIWGLDHMQCVYLSRVPQGCCAVSSTILGSPFITQARCNSVRSRVLHSGFPRDGTIYWPLAHALCRR